MVKVYAIVLAIGVLALIFWIFARSLAVNVPAWSRVDPEGRWGVKGRRVVAGMVGFGMAGMSAEFSPRDLSWPLALILALAGAAAAVWYAGWVDRADRDQSA
ncbi:MAG TPA: hypothetical protein VJR05_07705 [Acidimicrobiia bacterium]|nr:hypothetical protein [Acidimicrobiia bacterium]